MKIKDKLTAKCMHHSMLGVPRDWTDMDVAFAIVLQNMENYIMY